MLDTLPPELILAVLVDCGGSLTIRDLFTVRRLSKSLKSAAMEALRQRFTLFRKERFESNTYGPFEEAQALLGRLGNAQVEAASMIRYLSILGESWSTCFVFSNHLLTPVEAGESLMRCFTTEELLVTMVEFAWTLLPWDNEAEDEYVTVGAPHPFFYVGLIRGSVGFNGPPSPFNAKNDRVDKQGFGYKRSWGNTDEQKTTLPPRPQDYWFGHKHHVRPPGDHSLLSEKDRAKLFRMWYRDFERIELVELDES